MVVTAVSGARGLLQPGNGIAIEDDRSCTKIT